MKFKSVLPLFLLAAFMACEDSNTPSTPFEKEPTEANSESCTWVYEIVDHDHNGNETRLDYGEICVESAKGEFPEGHCEKKHSGQKGSLCGFEAPIISCQDLMLDPDNSTKGNGYISNKSLANLLNSNAKLGEKDICEIFLEEFLK